MEENKATETNVTAPEPKPDETDYKALYEAEKAEREKIKASFDKSASETAEYKRKLAERLTAEEKAKMEREQADKELREELEQLRNDKRVSNYTARLVSTGIDADVASGLAQNLPDGIPDQFFESLKKFIADLSAKIKADLLKEQPKLTSGMPLTTSDAEKAKDDKLRKAFGFKN